MKIQRSFTEGDKVHYIGYNYKENGIVKSLSDNKKIVFVVYKCNNEWDKYEDYTGQSTYIEDLKFGWAEDSINFNEIKKYLSVIKNENYK